MSEIHLVGLDFRSSSIEAREAATARVRAAGLPLAPALGAREAAALLTCNRVEVYAAGVKEERLLDLLGCEGIYRKRGGEAVRHLLRVAASIEAMVFGEPQILGQVRAAHARASEAGDVADLLGAAFESALRAGKRVRSETKIGQMAVSVPSVARMLARKIFGDLSGRAGLVLGAGEMADAVARYLAEDGMKLSIASFRHRARAEALANEIGGSVVTYDEIGPILVDVDCVVASTAAPHAVLTRADVERAMPRRGGRSLFLIDIAMPRDIEPGVAEVENAYLYSIDDLEGIAEGHRRVRAADFEEAERIVSEEALRFERRAAAIEAAPTLAALGARAEEIRSAEVEAVLARLGPDATPEIRRALERLSNDLIGKLLHDPLVEAKRLEEETPVREKARFLRKLFHLAE